MTRSHVVLKAIKGRITWIHAATILGISDRQMRRLKPRYEQSEFRGLRDYRRGKPRRKRLPVPTIARPQAQVRNLPGLLDPALP